MGVVHHATYPIWFEMGRTELLRTNGENYSEFENMGIYFVVTELSVKYKCPATYDDELTLLTELDTSTPVRLNHTYTLLRDETVIATALTTLACVDKKGIVQRFPISIIQP